MPTTYKNNLLAVRPSGHGRYRVEVLHYGKPRAAEITDMTLIDRYKEVRDNRARGYAAACQALVDAVIEATKNQGRN